MDNPNPDKAAKVAEIAGKLELAGTVLVTEYRGLNVPAQAALRASIKEIGGEFKIYKNTLTKLAAERSGVDLDGYLTGPTALAFAYPQEGATVADPVGLSKALTEFAKTNAALVIKGGVVDGATVSAEDVTALSQVPPREEMLAKFAGLLQAPMSKFAALLQAMPQNFAALLQALIDKGGAGDAGAAPSADAPAAEQAPADQAGEETDAADAEGGADEAPADAPAATEDAAVDAASDQTDEPAAADSEETDDKED